MRACTMPIAELLLAAAALALAPSSASGQAFTTSELDRLRQQRKFDEAERYCRQRLSQTAPADPARAEIVVELIRTLSLQAASLAGEDASAARQDGLWKSARQAAAIFLRSPHPRAALVHYQNALTLLAQGEIACEENEVAALTPERLAQARQTLREASSALEALERDLRREIPLRRRSPGRAGELSDDELSNLADHALHRRARADQKRSLLFERGSADQVALLLAANEALERLQTLVTAEQPLRPLVQLDLVDCQRLLGKFDEAAELAESLAGETQPPAIRARATAELLHLAVSRRDVVAVTRLLEKATAMRESATPELALAQLQALLFQAQTASGEAAKQRQAEAAQFAQQIEQSYGRYWGRRASQLIARSLAPGAAASAELLRRSADSYYLKNDYDRAIAAYDGAAAEAQKTGDLAAGFELAYKAALVEQQRGAHAAAAMRLRILAKRQPKHSQAAAAHLLAVWNAAQAASQAAKPRGEESATYAELLAEHVSLWPTAETADQARLWLGKLQQSRGDWPAAIAAYTAITHSSPHQRAAMAELANCRQNELAALAAQGKPAENIVQQAGALAELVNGGALPPEKLVSAIEQLAEIAARASAEARPQIAQVQFAALKRLSPQDRSQLSPEQHLMLERTTAEAFAALGRRDEALAAFAKLASEHPDSGAIQEGYARLLLASSDAKEIRQALDRWRLIASRSRPHTPRWLEAKYSVALAQYRLGQRAEALALLRFLLETPPRLAGSEWEARYRELVSKCAKE